VNVQPAIKRRIGIGLVAVLVTLLTSACATGQHAQTADEVPAIDATSGSVGSLQLHEVAIKTPPGSSYAAGDAAVLQLVVVNTGHDTDTLQTVTTPGAAGFQVFASAADASSAASPSSSSAADTSSAASPSSSSAADTSSAASSSSSSAASGSTSAASTAAPAPGALDVAAGQALSLSVTGTDRVLVLRLTKTLFPASSLQVTFTFAKAGSVTLTVPTQISSNASPPGISIPPPGSGTAG
jgi:copper(I)-binding protein